MQRSQDKALISASLGKPHQAASSNPLASLAADALSAEFNFRPIAKEGNAIPFLFKFIDYVSILLRGQYHVSIVSAPGQRCVSTDPIYNLDDVHTGGQAHSISEEPSLRLLLHDKEQNEGTGLTLEESTDRIMALLAKLNEDFTSHSSEKESSFVGRLAEGLRAVTGTTHTPQKDVNFVLPSTLSVADKTLSDIMRQTALHLDQALRGVSVPVSIGIRYFFEEWHLLRYEVMFGRWALFPEQWLNSAKANILTGFVQLKQTAIDKSIVFVPCHFGGIPWLVLCYECSGTESERERATYRIYRDLSSRVNTATRILGQHSFANELKRLFSITVAGNSAEGGQVRKMVVKEWSKLGFIYPIKPPILRQLTPETPTEKRLYVVRFSDGDWFLDDSEGNNPFVALTRPLAEQEGESWSSSLGDMVKRSLVKSATEELRSGQIQRERDIADAAYAVGHPLKHRFNSLEGELGALCSHVGVKLPSDNYTQELATSVVARLETCKRVATMMNIIASWRQAKTHGQVEEFLISKPYQLFEHLLDSHSIWVHTERRTVAIRSDDLVRLRQTIILPFQTRWGTNGRLVDSFYEEIIFELLLNVARYALSNQRVLSIALDPANPANPVTIFPGLIFSNACNKACKPQDLVQGEWTEWGDGREGGLRFISECLRITGAGSVHVKFEEDGANCVFRVRAGLQGLANTGHEANAT